jgi:aspartate racemase
VICSNTMHKVAPSIQTALSIPLIHITDATGRAITKTSSRNPVLLGTRYTMEEDFNRGILRDKYGLNVIVPDEKSRTLLHNIIYDELCCGIINPNSKETIVRQCALLRSRGADSVILGCTELTMILSQADVEIPVFDTTRIHANSALEFALDN